MIGKRYSEDKIRWILREFEEGVGVMPNYRKPGVNRMKEIEL